MKGKFFSKYMKYKKKYSKLKGGSTNDDIINTFDDQYITITFNDWFNDILNKSITKQDENLVFVLSCEKPIKFTLDKEESLLYIDNISKCYKKDSKMFLEKIISFARHLKIRTVELQDDSTIHINGDQCSMNLANLYIFLYGYSWYNQFGLKSKRFQDEVSSNEPIRNYTFSDFVENGAAILKSKNIEQKNKEIDDVFTYDDIIVEQLSDLPRFTHHRLFRIYTKLNNLYEVLNENYTPRDIRYMNSTMEPKEFYLEQIPILMPLIKTQKSNNGAELLERKKEDMKLYEHRQIDKENEKLLQNVHLMFSIFKSQFDVRKMSQTEVNSILANLRQKYKDESINSYEITDTTPIKNIVRIIFHSRLEFCESIKTQLLIEIIRLSKHLFMYNFMLSLTLSDNIET